MVYKEFYRIKREDLKVEKMLVVLDLNLLNLKNIKTMHFKLKKQRKKSKWIDKINSEYKNFTQ